MGFGQGKLCVGQVGEALVDELAAALLFTQSGLDVFSDVFKTSAKDSQAFVVGVIAEHGPGPTLFFHSGGGSGRVYTITYKAVDDAGNETLAEATVTVDK